MAQRESVVNDQTLPLLTVASGFVECISTHVRTTYTHVCVCVTRLFILFL